MDMSFQYLGNNLRNHQLVYHLCIEFVTTLFILKLIALFVSGSDHLRQVFTKQMGLTDQDIVALSGGHTLVCIGYFFRFGFHR